MRYFGENLVTFAAVLFCLAVLLTSSVEWDALPQHVEGFE